MGVPLGRGPSALRGLQVHIGHRWSCERSGRRVSRSCPTPVGSAGCPSVRPPHLHRPIAPLQCPAPGWADSPIATLSLRPQPGHPDHAGDTASPHLTAWCPPSPSPAYLLPPALPTCSGPIMPLCVRPAGPTPCVHHKPQSTLLLLTVNSGAAPGGAPHPLTPQGHLTPSPRSTRTRDPHGPLHDAPGPTDATAIRARMGAMPPMGQGACHHICPLWHAMHTEPSLSPPSRPAPDGTQPRVVPVLTPNTALFTLNQWAIRTSDRGHPAVPPHGGRGTWRRGGGRTNISVSPPRSVPALTHSALCHRPVPVGPRPRASSRPHHRIPGGWAESGCKTHSAQRRVPTWGGGGREGEGEGHPGGGVRERGATHRSGDSCSALALCRGDPTPPTAPVHNGRQRYGDGHRLAPSKPGPRATPAPCNAGVCAALLLVQRWHPGKVGVRATLEPMRRICATLLPVQIWLSCIAGLHAACRTGAHAKLLPCSAAVLCQHWHSCTAGVHANAGTQCTTVTHTVLVPMQRWCPCNTSSHAMLVPTPGIPATFLCNTTPAQQPVQQQHRQHCDVQPRPTAAHRGSQTRSPADPLHPHSSAAMPLHAAPSPLPPPRPRSHRRHSLLIPPRDILEPLVSS